MDNESMLKRDLKDFVFERILKSNQDTKCVYLLGHMKNDSPDVKAVMKLEKEAFDENLIN